ARRAAPDRRRPARARSTDRPRRHPRQARRLARDQSRRPARRTRVAAVGPDGGPADGQRRGGRLRVETVVCHTKRLIGEAAAVPKDKKQSEEIARRFGQNLRRARKRAAMSQEELAVGASLHRTEIGLIERGHRVARIDTLIKIASSLGVSPLELLDGINWT